MQRITRQCTTTLATTAAALALVLVGPPTTSEARPLPDERASSRPAAVGSHHAPKVRHLTGSVGPGFTISMSRSRTKAGLYDITVTDNSTMHNFHLTGDGVDKKTRINRTGTKVWHVRLKPGVYSFQCDMHPLQMNGTLRVVRR